MALSMGRDAVISDTMAQTPSPGGAGEERGAPAGAPPGAASRLRWEAAPNGRDLLAGITVLAVLVAILVVFTSDAAPHSREGSAEPLLRRAAATEPAARPAPAWSQVPVAAAAVDLGPGVAEPVGVGLAAARDKLARCAALDRRRRDRAAAPAPSPPAEIVLDLAARAGAVHVVGVEVTSPGGSPELVDCARRLLTGDAFAAPQSVPGRRYRLAHVLE